MSEELRAKSKSMYCYKKEQDQDLCESHVKSLTCVTIPTYNNASTIRDVVERTLAQNIDVIVVNDGSTDNTREILQGIDGIEVINLTKNSGKGTALMAGFRAARAHGYRYAITLDADGQHYPEDVPLMLDASQRNPDAIIVGARTGLDGVERSGGSRFANAFSNFWFAVQTFRRLRDTQSGFRLYPLKSVLRYATSRYEAELELLVFASWHGVDIVEQPVRVYYPPAEERVSHFRPFMDFMRITVLNTVLCVLAVVYALPLACLRWLRTLVYTLYSLLFFLFMCLVVLMPASLLLPLIIRDRDKCTWAVHRVLYFVGRTVMEWHGIPGVKCIQHNPNHETYSTPAMVICNHQSSLDLMAILAQSPKIAILTKDWVYKNLFFGSILRCGEYYPVSEGMDVLLPKLRSLVERGYSIMMFPEGTRSADCRVQRFHQGAFRIAQELDLDILPLVVSEPGRVLPKHGRLLRKGVFNVLTCKRVSPAEYTQWGDTKKIASCFRKYYRKKVAELRNGMP